MAPDQQHKADTMDLITAHTQGPKEKSARPEQPSNSVKWNQSTHIRTCHAPSAQYRKYRAAIPTRQGHLQKKAGRVHHGAESFDNAVSGSLPHRNFPLRKKCRNQTYLSQQKGDDGDTCSWHAENALEIFLTL